jgi:predicted transcriptional regulator
MPKIEIEQKRPLDATPARALSMFEAGVKQVEIAKLWDISPGRVSKLILKAKAKRASEKEQ